jgi:hypothetical protein
VRTFGIIVESGRDTAVYSTLIRRIRSDIERVVSEPCGGVVAVRRKFVGLLKHFQWNSGYTIHKAFVIRDADRKEAQLAEKELADILKQQGFSPSFPVHFFATRRMVETWLLADAGAVSEVAKQRGKTCSIRSVRDPLEEIADAKSNFQAMLSQARLPDDQKVYEEVASLANLDLIGQRCPYFQEFVKRVNAC